MAWMAPLGRRARGIGPGLSVAGDGKVDQAGMAGAQRGFIKTILPKATDLEVFDEHVGSSSKLPDDVLSFSR